MAGIKDYSTTQANNTSLNSINVGEGMLPSNLNNAIRALMKNTREWFNDSQWVEYGDGDGAYTAAYASATSFTIAGVDVSAIYHEGRRIKLIATTPGTIYGTISSSSFSTNTTVNVTWDSGSLSNEAIDNVYIGALSKTNNSLPTGVIATATLADGSVTTIKIADSAVTTAKINDAAVTNAKLGADSVNGSKIADDSIDSEHYVDGSIDTAHIADSQITTAKLAASSVNSSKIVDDSIVNADINSSAAIDATKIHDGTISNTEFGYLNGVTSAIQTQLDAKLVKANNLSDVTSASTARTNLGLGTIATQDANSVSITGGSVTGMSAPSSGSDVTTKTYVDDLVAGLRTRIITRAATTANIDLTADLQNGDTLDGVTLATNDKILVKNQTDQTQNGIYDVVASGTATRNTDYDTVAELAGQLVIVQEGTSNADTIYLCTTDTSGSIGSTNIVFSQVQPQNVGTVTSVGVADAGSSEFTVTNSPITSSGTINLAVNSIAGSKITDAVVNDTTPQLGGNLDLNSNDITGTGNIDNVGTITTDGLTVAGNVSIDGGTIKLDGNYPVGTANVALGDTALDSLTSGNENTAVGNASLTANTSGCYNVAIGRSSLTANTTGCGNTAIGMFSVATNTTGASNVGIGRNSLRANTTASNNTAVGFCSLYANTTGASNSSLGFCALTSNTTGATNTAIGREASKLNTTGSDNVAIGSYALADNSTSNCNVAVGRSALTNSTTGNQTAVGACALFTNTTGTTNSAFGYFALKSNTSGSNNTAIGREALEANTTGSYNNALGYLALHSNTDGGSNVAIGWCAASAGTSISNTTAIGHLALENTTVSSNTAVGNQALEANTTGADNNGFGFCALHLNTTGSCNTALGTKALQSNTTASNNTAVGFCSLYSNTTGGCNVAVGKNALTANTTSTRSVAVGFSALNSTTTGGASVAVGCGALCSLTTGSANTALGREAGLIVTTGSVNTYIGNDIEASSTGVNYEMVIASAYDTVGKGASTGFINPNGGGVYQGNNSSSWSTTSDRRIKKNITDNTTGLEKISQIQVRNFEYRTPEEITEVPQTSAIKKQGIQVGVIAQEIEKILPDVVKEESTGVKRVDPDNITWYLVNAIKELKAQNEDLKSRIEVLENS